MEWLDTMGGWLSDPNNQGTVSLMGWVLICFGLVLFVLALTFWRRRGVVIRGDHGGVAVGGDNRGIISTGEVEGDIYQHQVTPVPSDANRKPDTSSHRIQVLNITAAITSIVGTLFVIWDQI